MLGVLDGYDWYDLSYSSLSFHMSGVFCVFLLVNWYWFLRLIRPVMSVAIVTANTAVLWIFLIFWMLLLQLIFVIDRLLYSLCLGHRGLLVVYVFIVFRTFFLKLSRVVPPLQGTSGAPAPGSSRDPVSLRSRSQNDSNTVPVLVSIIHLLIIRVHYKFLIHGAWVACISGHSRPPGGVGLTPRQYTVWNVEEARSLYWRAISQ